jgi:predicted nuclease with TOPRIM domain
MGENCKECIQIANMEDKLRSVWHVLNELKDKDKDIDKRVSNLEQHNSANIEKFDRIFNSIESIEKTLDKIAASIELMQNKSAKTFDNLKYESIKYVIIAGIAAVVAKLLN